MSTTKKNYLGAKPARILRSVEKLILEEPRRMDMGGWLTKRGDFRWDDIKPRLRPPCGTVGCIAGWIKDKYGKRLPQFALVFAMKKLGLSQDEAESLFYQGNWPAELLKKLRKHTPGTKAYAKVVVRAIEEFIKTGFQTNADQTQQR